MLYTIFLLVYLGIWGLFLIGMHQFGFGWPQQVTGIDLLLLCLATFRLTEVVSEEKVARCLRAPFCELRKSEGPDGSFLEEEVPAGRGLRRMVGELLLCPWCTGIWIATLLTFLWVALPVVARLFLVAFASAAGGLLFQVLIKLLDRTRKALPD